MKSKIWRRKKKRGPWFSEIYEELEKLGDLIDETIQKAFETSSENTPARRSHVQGFSIKMGPDGKPKILEFKNRKPRENEQENSEEMELGPLVDLIEDAETLSVLMSLPGV